MLDSLTWEKMKTTEVLSLKILHRAVPVSQLTHTHMGRGNR